MIIKEFKPVKNKIVNKLKLNQVYINNDDFDFIVKLCGYNYADILEFFNNYNLFESGTEEEHFYIAQNKDNKSLYMWH